SLSKRISVSSKRLQATIEAAFERAVSLHPIWRDTLQQVALHRSRACGSVDDSLEIKYYPALPGPRALFLVETASRKEIRQVREFFDMVGHLATVAPVSHGPITTFAVVVDSDVSLFNKVEWVLKTQ